MFVECAKKVGTKCAARKNPNGDHRWAVGEEIDSSSANRPPMLAFQPCLVKVTQVVVPVLPGLQKYHGLFASLGLLTVVVRVVEPLALSSSEGNSPENDKPKQFVVPVDS